ncbi:MAG: hypothetical protein ABH867_04620 [Patescibacteria group bacterium]|nr:hypothetical protein [Patescibacteria group bacterium]
MEKAILKTLVYADLFDFPLTKKELWQRLVWDIGDSSIRRLRKSSGRKGGFKNNSGAGVSRKEFEFCLNKLNKAGKIEGREGFYFFAGRGGIVDLRKKRQSQSEKKLEKAIAVSRFLKIIPSIRLAAVTGSVASENAKNKDDIDLFLIASAGLVWTTRFLVTLAVSLLGVRRFSNRKMVKDKICLNLFLDEGHLGVFKKEQDLFLAYEIYQLKVLWQRGKAYQKFLSANTWLKKFLPNAFGEDIFGFKKDRSYRHFNWLIEAVGLLRKGIDRIFYLFQFWWMRKKRTTETAKPYLIAFHPANERSKILARFKRRISLI